MMTKSVKNIAKDTKENLTKNYQIANSKARNPKFRTWSDKFTLMQMELRPKSNLATKPQNDEDFQIAATENQEMNEPMVEQNNQ